MAHLEKIPLERATLVDRWRQSALKQLHLYSVRIPTTWALHCEVCQKTID